MNPYQLFLFPVLRALSIGDAERAHEIAKKIILPIQATELLEVVREKYRWPTLGDESVVVAGIRFPNPVGLAAGLDKQGDLLLFIQALGFGFDEVGTITPQPQKGSQRPRVARLIKKRVLWNRMGFNSDGADVVAKRLKKIRSQLRIPIGGSLGKQFNTKNEHAVDDYCYVLDRIAEFVDYVVANVSSPNTKDLRGLQAAAELLMLLSVLVEREKRQAAKRGQKPRPIFVKVAPDLTLEQFEAMLDTVERSGAAGVIIGNTTIQPPKGFTPTGMFLDPDQEPGKPLKPWGGYSGPMLFPGTCERIKFARSRTKLPLIAVGGISSGTNAVRLLDLGADLVQVYTSFIYQGPRLITEIRRAIDWRKG